MDQFYWNLVIGESVLLKASDWWISFTGTYGVPYSEGRPLWVLHGVPQYGRATSTGSPWSAPIWEGTFYR